MRHSIIISLKCKCFKIRQGRICIFYEVCKHHIRYSLIKICWALCWEYLGWSTCYYFRCTLELSHLNQDSNTPASQDFLFWWWKVLTIFNGLANQPITNSISPPKIYQLAGKVLRFEPTWSLCNISLLNKANKGKKKHWKVTFDRRNQLKRSTMYPTNSKPHK